MKNRQASLKSNKVFKDAYNIFTFLRRSCFELNYITASQLASVRPIRVLRACITVMYEPIARLPLFVGLLSKPYTKPFFSCCHLSQLQLFLLQRSPLSVQCTVSHLYTEVSVI